MIYEDVWKGCKHIRIKSDNTTAISYINNMGGIVSDSCNHLSKTIWYYCINRKVWLSAVHIPGKDNETIICLGFKMKALSGDYHHLFFGGFLKFFAANLKLISLVHA